MADEDARSDMRALAKKTDPGAGSRPGIVSEQGAEEAALVSRVAAGDEAAFAVLVDRHLGVIAAAARRMLSDAAEAEDVAQEAFLRLWTSAGGLVIGAGGVRPWLRRVASNLCIDRIRAGRHTRTTDDGELPEQAVDADQETSLLDRDRGRLVEAALKELPERQRQALVLFHYEGLSQIEVGKALGVSDEAVESLLARARRSMRAKLAGALDGQNDD